MVGRWLMQQVSPISNKSFRGFTAADQMLPNPLGLLAKSTPILENSLSEESTSFSGFLHGYDYILGTMERPSEADHCGQSQSFLGPDPQYRQSFELQVIVDSSTERADELGGLENQKSLSVEKCSASQSAGNKRVSGPPERDRARSPIQTRSRMRQLQQKEQ